MTMRENEKPITAGWRKSPPTVAEVRICPWWWNREPRVVPHVLALDIDDDLDDDVHITLVWALGGRPNRGLLARDVRFAPADWGGDRAEWAPCLPPTEDAPR
jgi:hypothetical protein